MAASLELLGAYRAGVAAGAQPGRGPMRHAGWLLELEQALLALNTGAGGNPQPAAPRPRDDPAQPGGGDRQAAGIGAGAAPPNAEGAGCGMTVHGGERLAYRQAPAWPNTADRATAPATGNGDGAQAFGAAAVLRADRALPSAGMARQGDAPETPATPAAATAQRAVPGYGMPGRVAAPAPEDAAEPGGAPRAGGGPEQQQPYAPRKLHLYHGDDGVHAWIRDSGLAECQAVAIALALRGELGGTGLRLAGFALNGRKVANLFPDQPMHAVGIPETADEPGQVIPGLSPRS